MRIRKGSLRARFKGDLEIHLTADFGKSSAYPVLIRAYSERKAFVFIHDGESLDSGDPPDGRPDQRDHHEYYGARARLKSWEPGDESAAELRFPKMQQWPKVVGPLKRLLLGGCEFEPDESCVSYLKTPKSPNT